MTVLQIIILLSALTMFFYVFINQVYKTIMEEKIRRQEKARHQMKIVLHRLDLGWNNDYYL